MLKHADIWRAIDRLAAEYEFSASGLAKQAGLDPTTFNKSKRVTPEGKLRWPSTESLAKVLAATGASFNEYVSFIGESGGAGVYRNIPLIGYSQAGSPGYFNDNGFPTGANWDEIPFPGFADPQVFALEISGDSLSPVFRDGDTLIVSPGSHIRRGDRVVVKTTDGELMVKNLQRQSTKRVELVSINTAQADRTIEIEKLAWMSRIIWASQ